MGKSITKLSIDISLSLATNFRLNFLSSNPDCSSTLSRLIEAFTESFCSAFNEMLAIMFCKRTCLALNFPGVFSSESTSYASFPRRINMELIRKSIFFSFLTVSLDANASRTNLKLGGESGVFLFRLMLKPNNCTLLIVIFPLKRGSISNLAERRVTFNISFPDWSSSNTSSIMIRFSSPISILPIVNSVPITRESSLATNTANFC